MEEGRGEVRDNLYSTDILIYRDRDESGKKIIIVAGGGNVHLLWMF